MDEAQNDFLKEVLNIGLGRASAALGEMTGSRIDMAVPTVTVCDPDKLSSHISIAGNDDVFTVTQSFSGILSGDVVLVMTGFSGRVLTNRLCADMASSSDLDCNVEEVVTEVGNIIINSFIGSWAPMFADQFEFGVPSFQLSPLSSVMNRYGASAPFARKDVKAVYAQAHMDVPDFTIAASLIVMFRQDSLERLVGSVSSSPEV